MADITILTEQLQLLVKNPDTFPGNDDKKSQLLSLSRQAAAVLE